MQEQVMVSDTLNSINSGLKSLTDMIQQTENQQLRQTLQQMRNQGETCQYELFNLARSKNYYQPAGKATEEQITKVKTTINSVESAQNNNSTSQMK
jgi:spore coat protein CotF